MAEVKTEAKGMIKAVIDMGTNTFNLLIARLQNNSFEQLLSIKDGVALGMGGINQNTITPEAQQRAFACLEKFKHYCQKWEVEKLVVVGTSSIRNAENSAEFIQKVNALMQIKTHVIDGKKEAELIYQGVKITYDFSAPATIIDIGGGSTEFIFANQLGIQKMGSFEIGISRVLQQFNFPEQLTPRDVSSIEAFFEEKTSAFLNTIVCNTLIGASGSFESLYEIMQKLPFPKEIEPITVDFKQFMREVEKMIFSTKEEREVNQYVIPIRRKMMHLTSVKIRWVIKKLNIQTVIISPCSIKEGALMIIN